jgi:hypothetical protein
MMLRVSSYLVDITSLKAILRYRKASESLGGSARASATRNARNIQQFEKMRFAFPSDFP